MSVQVQLICSEINAKAVQPTVPVVIRMAYVFNVPVQNSYPMVYAFLLVLMEVIAMV